MTRILFLAVLTAAAVTGCATQNDPRGLTPPEALRVASAAGVPAIEDEFPGEGWWQAYGDPQLNALIDQALDGPPALEGAPARTRAATSLVRAYGEFWRLTADRDAAEARARNRDEVAQLVEYRRRDGVVTGSAVGAAQTAATAAHLTVVAMDGEVAAARQRLATLARARQDGELALRTPSAGRAYVGLPPGRIEALISRRPDLKAARWRTAAAERDIEIARSAAVARPSLFDFLDRHTVGLNHLVRFGSDLGQARLAYRTSSLEGDGLRARIEAAEADRDVAAAAYARVHIGALREVAAATAGEHALDRQLTEARADLAKRETAYQMVQDRYAAGLTNRSAVLAAEEVVIRRRGQVAGLLARGMLTDAALVDALSGAASSGPAR